MTIAEKINTLPFYQACREADQLCVESEDLVFGVFWTFADGSRLASYIKDNTTCILQNND